MRMNHTNEIDLGDDQTEKLITLLEMIEDADSMQNAVWLSENGRDEVEDIRTTIEAQTGRE